LDGFLFMVNTEGKVEFVSENIRQFLNYSQDELVGKSIYNIIHHGDHDAFFSYLLPTAVGQSGEFDDFSFSSFLCLLSFNAGGLIFEQLNQYRNSEDDNVDFKKFINCITFVQVGTWTAKARRNVGVSTADCWSNSRRLQRTPSTRRTRDPTPTTRCR
jgi:hypothetical protein